MTKVGECVRMILTAERPRMQMTSNVRMARPAYTAVQFPCFSAGSLVGVTAMVGWLLPRAAPELLADTGGAG